ncbi:MAG: hypothetical protein Ta2D_13450 [Rickettsiales bacterium]|nr:MAG: hypothetical protein Ta2D_13450 [Rickettsiales bacterium]
MFEASIRRFNIIRYRNYPTYIEVALCDHCNLNCAYCTHCVPLQQTEKFYDLINFENDFKQLSKITNGYIKKIHLMGGEPLLNPQINRYLQIARQNFRKSDIWIITNGLLLSSMKDDFWNECKKQNIGINISSYPVKLNYEKIDENAKKFDVIVNYESESYRYKDAIKDDESKGMHLQPYNSNCKTTASYNWNACTSKGCTYLKEGGKLFMCAQCACINKFNTYFNKNLEVSKNDYLDIYKAKHFREILNYLKSPIPFCKYCDVDNKKTDLKWKQSERKIEEWYIDK